MIVVPDKQSFVLGMELAMRVIRNRIGVLETMGAPEDLKNECENMIGIIRIVQVGIGSGRMPLPEPHEWTEEETNEVERISLNFRYGHEETFVRLEVLPEEKRQNVRKRAQELADSTIDKFTHNLCEHFDKANVPKEEARTVLETMFGNLNNENDKKFERFYQLAFMASLKVILDEDERGENGKIPIQQQ